MKTRSVPPRGSMHSAVRTIVDADSLSAGTSNVPRFPLWRSPLRPGCWVRSVAGPSSGPAVES